MRNCNKFLKILAFVILVPFLCEYLIYYIVVWQCSWPTLQNNVEEKFNKSEWISENPVNAMFIADIHLLHFSNGHWFDRLRREWQMYRSFQTAIILLQPEVIFVLGDVFDAGICSDYKFHYYLKRLYSLFYVPKNVKLYVLAGNHDVGFHYNIYPYVYERFVTELKAPSVRLISIRNNHFVLINSMLMEGDECFLCKNVIKKINKISRELNCARGIKKCSFLKSIKHYSRPILLQHFPMYRLSDENCSEPEDTPKEIKKQQFKEKWDCLSKESSEMLYDSLKPRLIVGGHTHHGCHMIHREDIHEYSIPSFNWRYKNKPSFLLGKFLANKYNLSKCQLPQESTVILLYCLAFFIVFLWIIFDYIQMHIHLEKSHKKFF